MTQFNILAQSAAPQALADLLNMAFGPGRLARTAERLREGNHRITAYDRVAISEDGRLKGAISLWPVRVHQTAGLLLGPLAVHPDMQGQGVGQALMQDALAAIDVTRFAFTVLVGDLPYYQKAGFGVASAAISLPGPVDPQRLLLRPSAAQDATLCAELAGMVRRAPELC